MHKNTLNLFLKELNIKHTNSYSSSLFEEHPNKYNLYGISQMLNLYNIPNIGIKVENKDLNSLELPVIAHIGYDFVVVNKVTNTQVGFYWKGKHTILNIDKFIELWSGIALIAEPTKESIEPSYRKHFITEILNRIQTFSILTIAIALILLLCIFQSLSTIKILFLLCNLCGCIICYFLLQKQNHTESLYADKICSLFKQKDCNDILDSKVAKIFDWLSWSEIGMGFFISNILILITLPGLFEYVIPVCICALPYTIWSIWYQIRVAKQLCTLCLIVQSILWSIFFIALFNENMFPNKLNYFNFIFVGMVYLFMIFSINKLSNIILSNQQMTNVRQELNSMKFTDDVFVTLLKKRPYYKVSRLDSNIILGNPDSSICITILTNPHCQPCAFAHKKIERILKKNKDKMHIQYIFTAFNDNLLSSNKILIAAYQQKNQDEVRDIYTQWFNKGKISPDAFAKKMNIEISNHRVQEELDKHYQWKKYNQLSVTPTILINGYLLPENYNVDDLEYFCNINLTASN
ncbi:thioredoxin domain-containing protein [uncultured Phocaeicola sp.]|jgi:hypothetical protein|uniref:thioredoxin domain-containing protein n=2 Tax=uncultured Phocaeicola sp. TaxID=990718 RepID=UPI0025A29193|nr:thioredoxin domain-containing protein [uncultured Phocaeicola sp.]